MACRATIKLYMMLDNHMKMCKLSGIYIWVNTFLFVLLLVQNVMTRRIVFKLYIAVYYYMVICMLSEIYVWAILLCLSEMYCPQLLLCPGGISPVLGVLGILNITNKNNYSASPSWLPEPRFRLVVNIVENRSGASRKKWPKYDSKKSNIVIQKKNFRY